MTIGALGAGSDYSPFIQHLGIPSVNLGFGGEGRGGEYHSIYDSYDHFKRFKDPDMAYGIALAKTAGRITLRLANAEVLPFEFKSFHRTVNGYVTEVMTLLDNMREITDVENQMIKEKRYEYANDPTKKYFPPTAKDAVPFLNFSPLQNAMAALEKTATTFSDFQVAHSKPKSGVQQLNKSLYQIEQKLLSEKGLPRRGWYRHIIYAPGFYTGYGVKTLPGIREAIEQRAWNEAQEQIEIVARAIEAYTQELENISKQFNVSVK